MYLLQIIAVTFVIAVLFDSFFEWLIHRFLMHKRVWIFTYPFETHAQTHHRIFRADKTYHLTKESDKEKIAMAWWNGPILILITTIPFIFFSWIWWNWWISITALVANTLYYVAYERLHWCMHLPNKRELERSWIFFRLNGHHLLHHRYVNKNYNVVLPLADLLLGTLLLRSKVCFAQATGPSIPNVQPKR